MAESGIVGFSCPVERRSDGWSTTTHGGIVRLDFDFGDLGRRGRGTDSKLFRSSGGLGFTAVTITYWRGCGLVLQVGGGVGSGRMITATLEPRFATRSNRPFPRTARLVAEWSRKLDECFTHGSLVSNTVVDLGRVLSVVCPRVSWCC